MGDAERCALAGNSLEHAQDSRVDGEVGLADRSWDIGQV